MQSRQNADIKAKYILYTLAFFIFVCIGFLCLMLSRINPDKQPINLKTTKTEYAIRGNIYSNDGFTMATSERLYKVSFNPKNISPDKQELFVNLFSIYSGIPKSIILDKLKNSKGYTTISYNIPTLKATSLKLLNSKLNKYNVFQEYEENGRVYQKMGVAVEMSGYSRKYPYGDIMEPLLGYTRKLENQKITQVIGVKGSERGANNYLQAKQDGKSWGYRDIGFTVIQNKYSMQENKKDGFDITLTIPLRLQKKLEKLVDTQNQKLQAKEIIVGIMDSQNGKVLAIASSRRFDPKNIRKEDYSSLNISPTETSFEPGSIIKPIIYAILLQKNLIKSDEVIDLNNGVYRIGRHTIRDDHPLKSATPPQILIKSSNVGMIKLTQELSSQDFLSSLEAYGFGSPTGIDLPQEASGVLPDITKLKGSYKASASYGYGFRATFIQILRAYASFSNGGLLVTPRTIEYLSNQNGERFKLKTPTPTRIISESTAFEIQKILQDITTQGTGKKAYVPDIKMGGKTGTARIFIDGKYTKRYNSSFFGFASDDKRSYTIGVVVFDPNVQEGYYGSQTAAPIFKEVVELLIKEKYLKPQQ